MSKRPTENEHTEQEIERRATDALRRALTTPYKPQREMVGKVGRKTKKKPATKGSRSKP